MGAFDDLLAPAAAKQAGAFADLATMPTSRTDRLLTGMADPIHGGAQLLTKVLPGGVVQAGNRLNNWVADNTGLVPRLPAGGVDQQVREREAAYQAQRQAGGESGFDGYRVIGNVISPANAALAMRGIGATTLGARVAGGALTGGASALMNPVTQGDFASEKMSQIGTGAAFGAAMPLAMAGVGRLVSPAASRNPDLNMLRDAGVQPTVGQALGGRMNAAEERLASVPVVGDMVVNARAKAQQQFNNAALNRVGAPIGVKVNGFGQSALREIGDAASKAQEAAKNSLGAFRFDQQGAAELANVRNMVGSIADNRVRNTVNQMLSTLDDQMTNGTILPDGYKQLQSKLTKEAARMSGASDAYQQQGGEAIAEIARIMQETARRQNPVFDAAMRKANEAWANLVRVEGASKAASGNEGLFTPGQLLSAVRQADMSVRDRATARGSALMQDLATAGQNVLGNKVPNSGTADRLLPTLGLLGAGAVNAPVAVGGLLGGAALYSSPIQRALTWSLASRPESAEAVRNALLKASPSLVPLGSQVGLGLLNYPAP